MPTHGLLDRVLDKLAQYPPFWLGVYACGSLMSVVTVAGLFGGTAAGSAAGFFILAGTFGYDTLTRQSVERKFGKRLTVLEQEQTRLTKDSARMNGDLKSIRDDLGATAQTLNREVYKILNQAEPSARASGNAFRLIQRSFDRIGTHAHGTASPTARPTEKSTDFSAFLSSRPPANQSLEDEARDAEESLLSTAPHAEQPPPQSRAQKYMDMLKSVVTDQTDFPDDDTLKDAVKKTPQFAAAPDYSEDVIAELITQAVRNEKIEIFAQPIVRLPSRRLQYLELFARIRARSGIYLTGESYRAPAEKEMMIETVDHLLLRHVLDTLRSDARRGLSLGYFINISARTLRDKFYMADLLEFARTRRDLVQNIVFELQYKDIENLSPACFRLIDGLISVGCRFSVDNVPSANVDADNLAEHGFSFIKFNAGILMEMCDSPEGEMDVARLKSTLDKSHMMLIVEKMESEHDLKELLDFEIDLGEGYLFGRPDLEMAYRPRRTASSA